MKGSTSMVVVIGDDCVKFDINDARYTNGAIMVGDSVKVEYVGDLDEKKAKAVIVYLIPKKGNVVNAGYNSNAELKTKPMDSITKKKFDEFVESAKKDR